jgi:hypothetical protein
MLLFSAPDPTPIVRSYVFSYGERRREVLIGELPRIFLPRTPLNRGKEKGRDPSLPRPLKSNVLRKTLPGIETLAAP